MKWRKTGAAFRLLVVLGIAGISLSFAQSWQPLSPSGTLPGGRDATPAVLDTVQSEMILFGGFNNTGPLLDLWRLSLGASPSWSNFTAVGNTPQYVGQAVYDQTNSRMILFGGSNGGAFSNNVTVLVNANGVGGTPGWLFLNPTTGPAGPPLPRSYATTVYDSANNRMILFGGESQSNGLLNDLWVLTAANGLNGTTSWVQLSPTGTPPNARYGHTAVYDSANNRMIVFGGNVQNSTIQPGNDVWVLNNANGLPAGSVPTWTPLNATGTPPAVRAFANAAYDPVTNHMVIFGGAGSPTVYNDLYTLTDANGVISGGGGAAWVSHSLTGGPAPRYSASGVYNASTNQLFIFGGRDNGSPFPNYFNDSFILNNASAASVPTLSITKSHTGNFSQGQQNAAYTITVSNSGANTSGAVTVVDSLPSGLSLASIGGSGWNCNGTTCTRSDSLGAGNSYPPITLTVNVASNAGSPQVNVATVSGGGASSQATATDSTIINLPPTLSISKSHSGNFSQSQTNAAFSILVSNAASAGPTNGTVTVSDTIPSGMTLVNMSGSGWTCNGAACTRSDSLAGGSSYPAITVTVNVASNAPSSLTNTATVTGGGSVSPPAAQDTVTIVPIVGCSAVAFDSAVGGGALAQSCIITNPGGLTLTPSISPGAPWLSATIAGGLLTLTATPSSVVNPQAGSTYTGTVTIMANGSSVGVVTVALTLTSSVSIGSTSSTVPAGGVANATFTVTANGAWAVVNSANWVVINSPAADASGNNCSTNNGTVTYTVAANTAPTARTATLTVLSGCPTTGPTFAVATFTITQNAQGGCNSVSVFPQGQQTSFNYSAAGTGANDTTVLLNNTCTLASGQPSWITITSSSNSSFTFSVAAYSGTTVRTGSIQVGPGVIAITQNPPVCTYSINTAPGFTSTFPASGGQGSLIVHASAGCGWTATPSSSSLIEGLTPASLASGGSTATATTVTFTIPANNGTATQTGSIAIAGAGQTLQYAITQAPPTINGITPSYQCTVNPDPVRTLRAEGVAELTSDLVLICSGTSIGGVQGDVVVAFNANTSVTNHTLSTDPTNTITDALLLNLDSGSNTVWVLGQNSYRGVVAGAHSIRFPSVLLAPETGTFLHTFRITNLRVDASRLANALYGSSTIPNVMATVSILPPLAAPASGAPFQLAPSTAQTVGSIPYTTLTFPHHIASPSTTFGVGALATGGPGGTSFWPLTFTEQQAHALLPAVQTGQAPASTPGVQYLSESGFINLSAFGPETGYSSSGRWGSTAAAMGTRLLVSIANVPCSVTLYAPEAPTSGEAALVSADSSGSGGFAVVTSSKIPPSTGSTFAGYQIVSLTPANGASACTTTGSAVVTWEVTAPLNNSPSALTFDLYVYNPASASLSSVTFNGITSGSTSAGPAPLVAVSDPNPTAPVPRFAAFQTVSGAVTPTALSFFFSPPSVGGGGVSPADAPATLLAGAPAPQTSGPQCSQTVTASGTNNGSVAASNVTATIQGSGPLSGCFGAAGSNASFSGSTCTCTTNVPAGGSYTCSATSSSCTLQTYSGAVTSDGGNTDPNDSAGQDGQPPNLIITPVQSPSAFVQGDTTGDDILTVQVQNNGGDAPPGAVTVSGTLPDSRLTLVSVQPGADTYSQFWSCTVVSSTTWSCAYNNFPLQNAAEIPAGFTKFIATFHTGGSACSNVAYNQQVSVSINGSQYLSGAAQTIAVNGKLAITAPVSTTLPAANVNTAYSFTGFAASGGCGTYSWSATGLPAGLSMSTGGVISGTPTAGGSFSVAVTVSDPANPATPAQHNTYSLSVSAPSGTVTIQTSPTGLQFTVDSGSPLTAPQTLSLSQGNHNIALATPQNGPAGTRYAFSSWSDTSTANPRTITVGSTSTTYTADFQTQYQLTISASPAAGGTVSPATGTYYPSGTSVPISATPSTGYNFVNWTGSVANSSSASTSVTMSASEIVTANFSPAPVSVTIQTSPPGLQFTVDSGAALTAPQTLSLSQGNHTVALATPQNGAAGTRYAFTSWGDGSTANPRTITVGSTSATYTADFQTQYQLTISASPAAGGSVSPASGTFYPSGTVVNITAAAVSGYIFNGWTGSVANASSASTTVTMSAAETVVAEFSSTSGITIQTNPPGLKFSVDNGGLQIAPQVLPLSPGTHTIAVAPTQSGAAGVQYVFLNWSDGLSATHTITVGSGAATYTATFQTQYQLTISASPAADGTVTPTSGAFYSSGSNVTITAAANSGFQFTGWTGSVANSVSPTTTVSMTGPQTVVGNFAAGTGITIQTNPPGLQFTIDNNSTALTAPQTLNLAPGPHTIAVSNIESGGAGTQYAFLSWSDGGALSHTITVGATGATYTAGFQTQYLLTISASPFTGGTVVPGGGVYYNAGAVVSISATANSGYAFLNWTGNVTSAASASTTVNMTMAQTVTANFLSTSGLAFFPVTPCRIVDTRSGSGQFGAPAMTAGQTRSFSIPTSTCNIPSAAQAYALNVTVIPQSTLGYLTIWPTGQSQPNVSTLNSYNGAIVANAAIVPAGTSGAVSVYVTDNTQVILDINGYFAPPSALGLAFYPLTPCRVVDTRSGSGQFGAPAMGAGQTRTFPMPSSNCGIPATAQAYSLNMTVVPSGPLQYLTTWPAGAPQPVVSTLNAFDGRIVANAAIVPAGASGGISVFTSDATNVIIDINGYFAPPGSTGALNFYPAAPCRVADTRGATSQFGGPEMNGGTFRTFTIPAATCSIPTTAQGYSLNVTVVPPGPLQYLTAWPTGAAQPVVSTLNAYNGAVVANAAIVPAGANAAINIFVSDTTQVILDINGYFAP